MHAMVCGVREKLLHRKAAAFGRERMSATLSHLRERQEACLVCFTDPETSVENCYLYIKNGRIVKSLFLVPVQRFACYINH